MKVKTLLLVAGLILAANAYAQNPGSADIYYEGSPLTLTCDGGACVPDYSAELYLYWDENENGPDAADGLAIVAPSGPGRVNWNHQPINGEDYGLLCGQFSFADPVLIVRDGPAGYTYYYYFRMSLDCPDDPNPDHQIVWTSSVFGVSAGPQEVSIPSFSCDDSQCEAGCVPDTVVFIWWAGPFPWDFREVCTHLRQGFLTTIIIPVFSAWGGWLVVSSGCNTQGYCWDPDCEPAFFWSASDLEYHADGRYWEATITLVEGPGCCVCVDFFLPVGMESFTAVPRDNAVELIWVTRSESDADHFEITRSVEGHVPVMVHSERATNNASGASYIWRDESVVNGTTYVYSIAPVMTDGSRGDVMNSEAVTPGSEHGRVTEYALHPNFPNPFNPTTTIAFDLADEGWVTLKVFTALGTEVLTLVNDRLGRGRHAVTFDGAGLASGVYFYSLTAGGVYRATGKMLLVR